MSEMRNRTKEHFPMVLLTLLSIVQALALELLWSHVRETDYLLEPSWGTGVAWLQIIATFIGLVLIWVVYASNTMRFRWVPVTSDSVYPFFIGILEFMLVETLGPDEVGHWLMFMAVIFALMVWVGHRNMKRARADSDNADFFNNYEPATGRDFAPQITIVCTMAVAGVYLLSNSDNATVAFIALLTTTAILARQFYMAARFWRQTVVEDTDG